METRAPMRFSVGRLECFGLLGPVEYALCSMSICLSPRLPISSRCCVFDLVSWRVGFRGVRVGEAKHPGPQTLEEHLLVSINTCRQICGLPLLAVLPSSLPLPPLSLPASLLSLPPSAPPLAPVSCLSACLPARPPAPFLPSPPLPPPASFPPVPILGNSPYDGDIAGCVWNARSFCFRRNIVMYHRKCTFVSSLLDTNDFVGIADSHVTVAAEHVLKSDPQHQKLTSVWSYLSGAQGGVGLVLR